MFALEFFKNLSFITLYIILSFLIVLIFVNFKNRNHLLLFAIMSLSVANEILSYILILNKHPVTVNTNIYTIIHNCLWLLILRSIFKKEKLGVITLIYFFFSLINFILTDYSMYNFHIFITGALLYCTLFIYICYEKLNLEDFAFFKSNSFYLVFAPIMFFLGLSLIFGFQNDNLANLKITPTLSLFKFITYFVNIIYYTTINIYIFKEYKIRNG